VDGVNYLGHIYGDVSGTSFISVSFLLSSLAVKHRQFSYFCTHCPQAQRAFECNRDVSPTTKTVSGKANATMTAAEPAIINHRV